MLTKLKKKRNSNWHGELIPSVEQLRTFMGSGCHCILTSVIHQFSQIYLFLVQFVLSELQGVQSHIAAPFRSQWPRGLNLGSASTQLLGLRVRIPPGSWIAFCCEWCVLSESGRSVELITCPEIVLLSVVCASVCECAWVWSWSLDSVENWSTGGCRVMVKKQSSNCK